MKTKLQGKRTIICDMDQTILLHEYEDEALKHAKELGIPYSSEFEKQFDNFIRSLSKYVKNKIIDFELVSKTAEILIPYLMEHGITGHDFITVMNEETFSLVKDERIDYSLSKLKEKGYELVVLTDWFTDSQISKLEYMNHLQYITCVYGWDGSYAKPDERAIKRIIGDDDPAKYVMIGDSLHCDIACANKVNVDSIWINAQKKELLLDVIPTYIVPHFSEVLQIL